MKKVRCAIYTRKSSEDGLEQEFNSLDAQYEACAAYIASQKAEGWVLLPDRYDDGGISGGTMERPGLQRLLAEIDRGAVDQILVYKIDRLTRSLADFAKMVDRLDAAGTSFMSVTQSFNTATSMGRLTLNMLLSFAQFEREVTAERIRDKIAASKRKGLWMGATVPLGYAADGRSLKITEPDAEVIRTIYDLYLKHRNVRLAVLIRQHINAPEFRGGILSDASTDEIAALSKKLNSLSGSGSGPADASGIALLALIERIDIAPGEIRVSISADGLAEELDIDRSRIWEERLALVSPFQHRKRGVETKLIFGDEPADIDATLLRNIGRAHRYFDLVRSGKTFGEIAETEGVSKRRIQQLIELAFLAPDIIRDVRDGKQPVGLISDWLMRHAFSRSG
ncbi:MAG TPA: recombinase family protein [Gammaproteobacteria bacterium]|nr:recombinase family protein [Gammaproteobacteria bacterium]